VTTVPRPFPQEWFTPGEPVRKAMCRISEGFCPYPEHGLITGQYCPECGARWSLVWNSARELVGFSAEWGVTPGRTWLASYPFSREHLTGYAEWSGRVPWDRLW
jgi:hypothetical protein